MNFPLIFRSRQNLIAPISSALTRLTWDEVMSVSLVFVETAENSKHELKRVLANNAGKTVALGLQSAEIFANKGRLVVEFANSAPGNPSAGTASPRTPGGMAE